MIRIDRPLDFLQYLKNRKVAVYITNSDDGPIIGELETFDMHINLIVKDSKGEVKFIKGDRVIWVKEWIK